MKGNNQTDHSGNTTGREKKRLEKIKLYLLENLSKDLSTSVVANQFQMSVSSLQHLFKKYQGQPYHKYLEDIRMIRAFELITKEGMRVQQAMFATGYKYKSTFNKSFKRRFGHSPGYFKT